MIDKFSFSSYWNRHKKIFEEKIHRLTNEINQLKKNKINVFNSSYFSYSFNGLIFKSLDDLSKEIYEYNENILHAKRETNKLQMEVTDKNTIIYNLYKKIECFEQALIISKQRMNAQLNEIQVKMRN